MQLHPTKCLHDRWFCQNKIHNPGISYTTTKTCIELNAQIMRVLQSQQHFIEKSPEGLSTIQKCANFQSV